MLRGLPSCTGLGIMLCSWRMAVRSLHDTQSCKTHLFQNRRSSYQTRRALPVPCSALKNAPAGILIFGLRVITIVDRGERAILVVLAWAVRDGRGVPLGPVVGEGELDDLLETGEAGMYVLVRFARSIRLAEFWHLASDALNRTMSLIAGEAGIIPTWEHGICLSHYIQR